MASQKQRNNAQLREAVRILRDQGLVRSNINLSKIVAPAPGRKRFHERGEPGYRLAKLAEKYDDVVSGKADAYPVEKIKDGRRIYQRTKANGKDFLIVPKSADETTRIKDGRVIIEHPAGIERTQIPVEYHNLEQYLNDLAEHRKKGQFGFRFKGGSSAVYRNWDQMIEEFAHYRIVTEAIESGDARFQREVYRNLEIVEVKSKKVWNQQKRKNKEASKQRRKRKRSSK